MRSGANEFELQQCKWRWLAILLSSPTITTKLRVKGTQRFLFFLISYLLYPLSHSAAAQTGTSSVSYWNDRGWEAEEKEGNKGKEASTTLVQNNQEYRLKYWATRSSVLPIIRTAHSFACSTLLASLMGSAALTCLLARLLCSLPCL